MTLPSSAASPPSLWVVAACFNEAAGIQAFIQAIEAVICERSASSLAPAAVRV